MPDVLDHTSQIIGEVKNTSELSYTSQIKDFNMYAQREGYQFQLTIRQDTILTDRLQTEVANGNIRLNYLPKSSP